MAGHTDSIYRQAAIDALCRECSGNCIPCDSFPCGEVEAIQKLPPADVQPRKTAEWVYGEKDGADGWYCSECKFHIPWYYDYYGLKNIDFIRDFHTCPHCDAKMIKYTGMKGEWSD